MEKEIMAVMQTVRQGIEELEEDCFGIISLGKKSIYLHMEKSPPGRGVCDKRQ